MRAISRTTIACLLTHAVLASTVIAQSKPREFPAPEESQAESDNTVVVDLVEPSENVVLNGPLQVPFGQVVDVLAKAVATDDGDGMKISVQSVDGVELTAPVAIRAAWLKPDSKTDLDTSALRLRGFQGGEFVGTPAAVDATASGFEFQAVFMITRRLDAIGPAEKRQLEDLIEQLVLEDDDTFQERSRRFVKRESSMRVENATRKLTEFSRAAWPILMQHFTDSRPAPAVQPANGGHTVGVICMDVIRRQIIDVPEGYPVARTRKVKGGAVHLSPRLTWGFHPLLKDWLVARKDKPLQSIQADVLRQLIAEEDRLGYPDEATKAQIRTRLIEHLDQLVDPTSLTSR